METEPKNLNPADRADSRAQDQQKGAGSMKISSNREIAIVQADYLALANDLEQAQALASSLEMELSGKSNELARFKAIWERTQGDLAKFERDMEALRQERHTLANEAQRGRAYEIKYQRVQAAHDELVTKVERLESELTREREAHLRTKNEVSARPTADPKLRATLEDLRAQIDRALSRATGTGAATAESAKSDHIEIEFGT